MQVIKRDGSIEEFDYNKIIRAVENAFKSCSKIMPQYLYNTLKALFSVLDGDTIGIEEIQDKVMVLRLLNSLMMLEISSNSDFAQYIGHYVNVRMSEIRLYDTGIY